jgi:hypothetical protein
MIKEELKSIKINKNVHKKLKIFCSENDINIKKLIEKLILEHIEKNNQIKNDIN